MNAFPPFKRTTTEFVGGEVTGFNTGYLTRAMSVYCDKQPVKIIRAIPENGNEDEDDRFEVEFANFGRTIVDGCDLHPHPDLPATNEERIAHFMKWTRAGVVGQAFVFEAMRIYAEQVERMPEDQRARMDEGMMPYATWKAAADDALAFLADNT